MSGDAGRDGGRKERGKDAQLPPETRPLPLLDAPRTPREAIPATHEDIRREPLLEAIVNAVPSMLVVRERTGENHGMTC